MHELYVFYELRKLRYSYLESEIFIFKRNGIKIMNLIDSKGGMSVNR